MNRMAVLLSAIAIAGCATVSKTYAPDGREAYWVDCTHGSPGMCYQKAGASCNEKGYEIITEKESNSADTSKGMLIVCK